MKKACSDCLDGFGCRMAGMCWRAAEGSKRLDVWEGRFDARMVECERSSRMAKGQERSRNLSVIDELNKMVDAVRAAIRGRRP